MLKRGVVINQRDIEEFETKIFPVAEAFKKFFYLIQKKKIQEKKLYCILVLQNFLECLQIY